MPDTKTAAGAKPGKGATKSESSSRNSAKRFTAEEREAMQERARELKASRGKDAKEQGLRDLLAKIEEMPPEDRDMAERIHAVITKKVPELTPKTWYGMPAYAKDDKIVCFFQPASKFKARYSTFGFSDEAMLDDGEMWPTSWALRKLSAADEDKLAALVKRSIG